MPGGHHGGHSHGRGGGRGFYGWWGPPVYYVTDPCYINELGQRVCVDPAIDLGDAGGCCGAKPGQPCRCASTRSVSESERAARARAERDPATRARITNAHALIARAHGTSPAAVHALHRAGRLSSLHAARAGLTRGEAAAAGIR